MGLLDVFKSSGDKAKEIALAEQKADHDRLLKEWEEEASIVMLNGLQEAISNAIQKQFNLNDFQTDIHDDRGGFFDVEFDLQSTSARLKSLYAREPWCYTTADRISRSLSRIPFVIKDKATGEILEDHPANEAVCGGNPNQSGYNLNWSGYIDLIMGGNFFKVFDENYGNPHHVPIEFINLKLRNVGNTNDAIMAEKYGLVEALEISRSTNFMANKALHCIPYENVIHFKLPNPYTPLFGMSPYTAASRPILLDRHKNEFEMAFYLRGATNAGAIETTEDITKKRMDRLMRTFEQAFTGKRNWWRTIFLPKGAKWVNSGLTMAEMEHLEGLKENRRTLLSVLGVPPSQVGIVEDVNRATAEVQERAFWELTIVPLALFIADGYNDSYLFKEVYAGTVEVCPDFSGIEALEGSWVTRGENAKAVDDVATINEQREIAGLDPLKETDPRGVMFVSEMRAAARSLAQFGDIESLGPHETEVVSDVPIEGDEESERNAAFIRVKANTTANQQRLAVGQARKYMDVLKEWTSIALTQAEFALRKGKEVRLALQQGLDSRQAYYADTGLPFLGDTMLKGYDLGTKTTKDFYTQGKKVARGGRPVQFKALKPADEQALQAIKQKEERGRRLQLAERNITSFYGFDDTQTEQIMQVIEDGLADGKTTEQIAKTIEQDYGERYGDQAFTIARTEVLSAVSAGLQWQQDGLKQIFDKVNKQWFHVGDVGSNPDARVPHADFEALGEVSYDYIYENPETGGRLSLPRDPKGGAKDVINCRCSMVSVVPSDATSNASTIIAQE